MALRNVTIVADRLGEDKRLLRYGIDSLELILTLTKYHNVLLTGLPTTALWTTIETIAAVLESYYIPIKYDQPRAGIISQDALTRTLLKNTINLCRNALFRAKSR